MNGSLKSRMAAFQQAAAQPHTSSSSGSKPFTASSSNKSFSSKKKFGSNSSPFPSSSSSSSSTSWKAPVSTSKPSVGKLNKDKMSLSSSIAVPKSKSPSVGKLNKDKTNAIASVLGGGGTYGGKAISSTNNSPSTNTVRTTKPSTPFQKSDLTAGASTTQSEQSQASMSEKAKGALVAPKEIDPAKQDWKYLNELSLQYDQLKLQGVEETKHPNSMPVSEAKQKAPKKRHEAGDKKNIKSSLEGLMGGSNLTANGNFLNKEYIDQYLVKNEKFKSLSFDFSGQTKLYKRFDRKDSEQRSISQKFVETLLQHPQANEITILNMSNALLPDVFLVQLCEQCTAKNGLPNLQVLNLESNLIAQNGVVALSECITNAKVWKRLQILKLENQKMQLPSDAEEALGEALLQSPSLVVVSLRVRSGLARQQINNSVAHNIDILRQARRQHASQNGTLKERKRNEMEQYFDKIAANDDPSISSVDLTGNLKFLGLHATERTKAATAFATNATVKTLKMVKLKLDDAFAKEFGKALASNTTLEKVCLDSNDISGTGIKALLEGLGKNTTVVDFQVRHQSKTMASSDEQGLPDLLTDNKMVIKLGVDVRNQLIKQQLERKTNANRDWQRKQRVAQKK